MSKMIFKGLNKRYLKKSLLKNGLFSNKLIPIFDGTTYEKFVASSLNFVKVHTDQEYGLIRHRIVNNKNSIRIFQIPHPHAYAILCNEICNSWKDITGIIERNWTGEKINLLHVRKMASERDCIFCMDYSSKVGEVSDALLKNAIGMKYMVRADISTFFPSIYSHSVTWAAVGRKQAFINRNNKNTWYNKLDKSIRNCNEKESIGLPIGPHTSNIISDLVLSNVDIKLLEKNFKFVRYIDDYQCYTESKERAEEFIVTLSDQLAKIRLNMNRSKTKVYELPHPFDEMWPNKIKKFIFSKRKGTKINFDNTNYREIVHFLDYTYELSQHENNDAPLRYAIKMLINSKFNTKAFYTFEKYVHYLILIYPYLSDFVYGIYTVKKRFPKKTDFIDQLFNIALEKKLYASVSRSIYACIRFSIQSQNINNRMDEILETEDSISITALMLYCIKFKLKPNLVKIVDFSKSIILDGRVDEYWILIYELFKMKYLKNNDLKNNYHGYQVFNELKQNNVSFFNNLK